MPKVIQRHSQHRSLGDNICSPRPTQFGIVTAALMLSSQAYSQTTAAVPAIFYKCDTCASYADIVKYLGTIGGNSLGDGIVPGYSYPYKAIPGITKIVVTSTNAPITFAFNYSATKKSTYSYLNIYYYIYTFTPNSNYPATDSGALQFDTHLFGVQRATGLGTVEAPAVDLNGRPVDYIYVTTFYEDLQKLVSYNLFTASGPATIRTLPGIFNWKLLPSIAVWYKGKHYILYDGTILKVKLADGTIVEMKVLVGRFGATTGFLDVIKVTPPPGQPISQTAPSVSITFSGLNPDTLQYDNVYKIRSWTDWNSLRTGTLTIIQSDINVPDFYFLDVLGLIG